MKIVIVGGGTIGWLTTFVMSKIRPKHQYINITKGEEGSTDGDINPSEMYTVIENEFEKEYGDFQ